MNGRMIICYLYLYSKAELDELSTSNALSGGAYWKPGIFMDNARGEKPQRMLECEINEKGESWVVEKRIQNCLFELSLELHDFPLGPSTLLIPLDLHLNFFLIGEN